MKALKVAIIGCGPRSNGHAAAAKPGQNLEVVYACDREKARADRAAAEWGVRAIYDTRPLMEDRHLEAVIIATDVRSHLPLLEQAIDAGKHVIVEKPLGDDVAKARALVAAAEKKRSIVYVSYQKRFAATYTALHAGAVQVDPVQVLCTECRGMMKPQFLNTAPFCGIMDCASHQLDLAGWLMKRAPRAVTALVRCNTFTQTGAADTLSVLIDFGDGRSAVLLNSIGAREIGSRCEVIGARGNVVLDASGKLSGVRFEQFASEGSKQALEFPRTETSPDTALQAAFARAVREGAPSTAASLQDGLNGMLLILACHRSAELGRRVELAELE